MTKFYEHILLILLIPAGITAQNIAGTFDSTFNQNGQVLFQVENKPTQIEHIQILPNGKYLMIGSVNAQTISPGNRTAVIRYNSNGTPDSSFNGTGAKVLEGRIAQGENTIVLPDQSIISVATGYYPNSISFYKLDINGKIDSSFGQNGYVNTFSGEVYYPNLRKSFQDASGRIIVIGEGKLSPSTDKWIGFVARYTPEGKRDSTFNDNGEVVITDPDPNIDMEIFGGRLSPDGRIFVTGNAGSVYTNTSWLIACINADGTLDQSFGNGGILKKSMGLTQYEACADIHFFPDGKFVAAGWGQKSTKFHFTMARFSENGTQDMSYGVAGKAQISVGCCYSFITEIAEQADGKIVACGYATKDNIYNDFAVARFNPDGSPDSGFGIAGGLILKFEPDTIQYARSVAIDADGKILVAGYTSLVGEFAGTGVLVRLLGTPVTSGTEDTELPDFAQNLQLSPNPVAGNRMQLAYSLEEESTISLDLFDLTGRKIKNFYQNQSRPEGDQTELVELPENLVPGVYFLTLSAGSKAIPVKLIKLP